MRDKRKKFLLQVVVFLSCTFLFSSIGHAFAESRNAKTPPPPTEYQVQGLFNPNHKYLMDGTNSIMKYSNGVLQLAGTTFAKESVDSIGITFYLQKWNGSSWEVIGSGSTFSTTNAQKYTNNDMRSGESGYYFRVRSIHWAQKGGTYESGERISDYILLN